MKLSVLLERLEHVNIAHKQLNGNLEQVKRKLEWGITLPGDFICHDNQLISLRGAPENVIGTFDCERNLLTDLEGCPLSIGKSFICKQNKITSLEITPKYIRGDFDVSENKITNLQGIEDSLHTLKGKFILSGNPITAHISGILRIKDIEEVVFTGSNNKKALEAFAVINALITKLKEDTLNEEEEQRYRMGIIELKKRGLEDFI